MVSSSECALPEGGRSLHAVAAPGANATVPAVSAASVVLDVDRTVAECDRMRLALRVSAGEPLPPLPPPEARETSARKPSPDPARSEKDIPDGDLPDPEPVPS